MSKVREQINISLCLFSTLILEWIFFSLFKSHFYELFTAKNVSSRKDIIEVCMLPWLDVIHDFFFIVNKKFKKKKKLYNPMQENRQRASIYKFYFCRLTNYTAVLWQCCMSNESLHKRRCFLLVLWPSPSQNWEIYDGQGGSNILWMTRSSACKVEVGTTNLDVKTPFPGI